MKRTGSIGSRVPPAVTTMCRPARSGVARRRRRAAAGRPGRAPGPAGRRRPRRPHRRSAGSSASRPTPVWPDASGPPPGSTIAVAEVVAQPRDVGARRRMAPHLAVHRRRDDDRRATSRGTSRSPRRRPGRSPSRPASAPSPARRRSRRRCRRRRCGRSGRRAAGRATSVSTGWRVSAANAAGRRSGSPDGVSSDGDVGALGPQQARTSSSGLVGGDRAGDPERDQPAGERGRRPRRPFVTRGPARSGSPPPTSAWRIARPLSVSSGRWRRSPSSAAGPRRGRQAAGQDRPDVAPADAAGARPARAGPGRGGRRRAPGSRRSCPTASR